MTTYEEIIKKVERNKSKVQTFIDDLNNLLENHDMKMEIEGWVSFYISNDRRTGVTHNDVSLPDRISVYRPEC